MHHRFPRHWRSTRLLSLKSTITGLAKLAGVVETVGDSVRLGREHREDV